MTKQKPTIKGIFVNAHLKMLRELKGEAGLRALEKKMGRRLRFRNTEAVPVREEVKIIECILDLTSKKAIPKARRAFEAGRLHFRNFLTTPLAKIVFGVFRKKFKFCMMQARHIASHVFRGAEFTPEDLGAKRVRITMKNNDYPLDHFRGIFQEWMDFAGLRGTAKGISVDDRYEYTLVWS